MSSVIKMGKQSLGKGRDAHRQGVDLSAFLVRGLNVGRRAQARDAVGRAQRVGPGSSGGSTRGSPLIPTDNTVAGREGPQHYRRHETSSASDQEAATRSMIQNKVSPSSAASSPVLIEIINRNKKNKRLVHTKYNVSQSLQYAMF